MPKTKASKTSKVKPREKTIKRRNSPPHNPRVVTEWCYCTECEKYWKQSSENAQIFVEVSSPLKKK